MKQGAIINTIVILLLLGAILLYLGGAIWRGLRDPYPTVAAYAYSLDDTVECTGYLVRREQVLTGSGSIVRLTPAEGEKVAAGSTVALIYADEGALERSDRLEVLRNEEEQLATAIATADEGGTQGEKSSQVVIDSLIKLRSAVEAGDFTRLESQTATFKAAVYQQAQRYGDADALSAALSATRREIDSLRAQQAESIGRVTTSQSGIFSGQVDGYESILTPAMLDTLTPAALDALDDRETPVSSQAIGKLITSSTWYFVCPLTQAQAARLTVGRTITVRFSRDWSGEVTMKVEKLGKAEDGRVTAIFSANSFLSNTTLLRRQTVELVFEYRTGLRVPTQAIRVETETQIDPATGQETQVQVACVYVQVGITTERKPITVLAQGEDYTLVKALVSDDANERQQRKALRAGDLVIIARGEIWDGMVLE